MEFRSIPFHIPSKTTYYGHLWKSQWPKENPNGNKSHKSWIKYWNWSSKETRNNAEKGRWVLKFRWYNSLAATEKEANVWTLEDDVTLIQACKKYGHRWSRLTKEFSKCINDNKLKNHFYSTVRKIVRVINAIIKEAKKQYQADTKNQMVSHYSEYDHFVLKEISKLRTF